MSVVANVAINVDATKAVQQLKQVDAASKGIKGGLDSASVGAKGLGGALVAALAPIVTITAAVEGFRRATEAAFGRAQAETRLKALSAAYGENAQVAAMAASASEKFGLTQTEASQAVADVYGRLRPLGFGLKEVNGVYEGFNILSKQAALSSAEAGSVFTQLSQALGSGTLRGDEFNRMAESMPSILGAVAKELGVSQTQLRGMAADGKITSEVVVKALQEIAESGGDLNKFLDPSTIAMNNLRKNTEEMFVQIGKLFGPAVVAGMNFLSTAIQKVAEGWQYFSGVLLPKLLEALDPVIEAVKKVTAGFDFETIINAIQGGMIIAINGMTFAVEKLAPIVGFVIEKFAQLAQNPVFKFIAEQVGRLVTHLGEARGRIDEYKAKQVETTKGAMDLVKQSSQLPPRIEDAKEKTKQLKEAQDAVTKAIEESGRAIDANATANQAIADQRSSVTQGYLKTEMQINDVLLEQLNRQLDGVKTQAQRIEVARNIYQLTVKQAKLEYRATKAQIDGEVQKAHLALMATEQKAKEVQLIVELAIAQGDVNSSHYKSLQLAREAVDLASVQAGTARLIAAQQERAAKAILEGKINAADAAFQVNILAKNTTNAASQANILATNTTSAASAAAQYAGQMERGAAAAIAQSSAMRTYQQTMTFTAAQAQYLRIGPYADPNRLGITSNEIALLTQSQRFQNLGQLPAFAQGGVVTKPTLGLIGEGGESEYIVPESKAAAFAANYLSGARGSNAIPRFADGGFVGPINVQTGPVMQQDGQQYVSMGDLESAMQTVVNTILGNGRTAGGRRYAGVA